MPSEQESAEPDVAVAAEPEDPREAWLNLALSDLDGGAAAVLATAARHGRPLPRREP